MFVSALRRNHKHSTEMEWEWVKEVFCWKQKKNNPSFDSFHIRSLARSWAEPTNLIPIQTYFNLNKYLCDVYSVRLPARCSSVTICLARACSFVRLLSRYLWFIFFFLLLPQLLLLLLCFAMCCGCSFGSFLCGLAWICVSFYHFNGMFLPSF